MHSPMAANGAEPSARHDDDRQGRADPDREVVDERAGRHHERDRGNREDDRGRRLRHDVRPPWQRRDTQLVGPAGSPLRRDRDGLRHRGADRPVGGHRDEEHDRPGEPVDRGAVAAIGREDRGVQDVDHDREDNGHHEIAAIAEGPPELQPEVGRERPERIDGRAGGRAAGCEHAVTPSGRRQAAVALGDAAVSARNAVSRSAAATSRWRNGAPEATSARTVASASRVTSDRTSPWRVTRTTPGIAPMTASAGSRPGVRTGRCVPPPMRAGRPASRPRRRGHDRGR